MKHRVLFLIVGLMACLPLQAGIIEHGRAQTHNALTLDAHIYLDANHERARNEWIVHYPMRPKNPQLTWQDRKHFTLIFDLELIDWTPAGMVKLLDLHSQGGLQSTMGLYAIDDEYHFVIVPTNAAGEHMKALTCKAPIRLEGKARMRVNAVWGQPESTDPGGALMAPLAFVKFYIDGQEICRLFGANIHPGPDQINPFLQLGIDGLEKSNNPWPPGVYHRRARYTIITLSP